MSGREFNKFSRRKFLKITAGSVLLAACRGGTKKTIPGVLVEPDSRLGHMMRDRLFPQPEVDEETDVVILGGGVSGLSAARWLKKNGVENFRLLELAATAGGNAASGSNAVSEYPWAAHYLPIPNAENTELLDFLAEIKVIRSLVNGIPEYDEQYVCFEPQERLFIKGVWQNGLIPEYGLPLPDNAEMARFLQLMNGFRNKKGADNKPAFAIPVDDSSSDAEFRKLDEQSMDEYLATNNFSSPFLLWYINYCCLDDFGTTSSRTSAWAGIHYFASRRGVASNAEMGSVLTWPEGNAFLARHLTQLSSQHIQTACPVYDVKKTDTGVEVCYYDDVRKKSVRLKAGKVISCVPQFVNARIFSSFSRSPVDAFTYCPWMVANITVNNWPDNGARPLSWDNVCYGSSALGYVDATHQVLQFGRQKTVLTWYCPIADKEPADARTYLRSATYDELQQRVIDDLLKMHPDCEEHIETLDIRVWGHAMIRPLQHFMWSGDRVAAQNSIDDRVFFAHSDLGGISIFEEAFYSGIRAAKQVLEV